MDYKDLKVLDELRKSGAITEEEYQKEKQKIFDAMNNPKKKEFLGMNENSYIAIMHVSQLVGYIVPLLGFLAPIVLWMMNKDDSVRVDSNGKNIINFLISWVIYIACAGILSIIVIGIPILITLLVLQIIFTIMATLKALDGEFWNYPLSLTIIR